MSFDFASFRRSVQSLEGRLASIRGNIDQLQRKRSLVHAAPVAKDDVKALVSQWVQDAGASYTAEVAASVSQMARTTSAFTNQARLKQLSSFGAIGLTHGVEANPRELGQALCFMFGKQVRETMVKLIDSMDWPEASLTSEQRNKEVSDLDVQIINLQAEEQEIISKAADVGITLG